MMRTEMEKDDGFCINVYSPGNFIAKTISIGTLNMGGPSTENNGFSDKQIGQALLACVGKDRVIDAKWKWAGAYWYLRWACNYPVDPKDFCQKISDMKLDIEEKYRCEYRNIREQATLSFMSQDATKMQKVQPSKNDEKEFAICREVALKLAEELGKTYLPKI